MSILLYRAKSSNQILPREIVTILVHLFNNTKLKGWFRGQTLTILSNWDSFYMESLHKMCKSFQKKASFCKIVCSPKHFTPTRTKILLHHICDISQLWNLIAHRNISWPIESTWKWINDNINMMGTKASSSYIKCISLSF